MKGVIESKRSHRKTRMKKIIALTISVFLLFSMTSCASISNISDFIGDTVPNAIATQIKNDIIPADNGENSTNAQKNNVSNDQSNTPIQSTPLPSSPSSSTDGDVDYAKLINKITTDTIKACVNITTAEFNTQNATIPLKSSIGSGVIFKATKKTADIYHYYVLTNYHVAELSDAYKYYKYTITDYQGNEYNALDPSWLYNDNIKNLCKKNDLAILEFETTIELKVLSMETKDPAINDTLISIGQPKGQQNAITMGNVKGYTSVSLQGGFVPSFNVIAHDAPIDHGNSGGAILNTDLKLIGINFAGSWEDDGTFAYGYGIPIKTVRKFLSDYGISL